MKQYVLDYAEPAATPAQPGDAPESVAPPPRISWHACRSLVLLIVLESIALALLYVALIGFPSSQASAEAVPVAAAVPALPVAAPVPVQEPVQASPLPQPEVVAEVEAPPSRIVRERGHYVIELHSAGVRGGARNADQGDRRDRPRQRRSARQGGANHAHGHDRLAARGMAGCLRRRRQLRRQLHPGRVRCPLRAER